MNILTKLEPGDVVLRDDKQYRVCKIDADGCFLWPIDDNGEDADTFQAMEYTFKKRLTLVRKSADSGIENTKAGEKGE